MSTVAHQFDELSQQHEAGLLGIWIFLATEVLFFGAMFFAYAVYRHAFPEAFAKLGQHMDVGIGTLNTGILLTSSVLAALAVAAARTAAKAKTVTFLAATALLGLAFDALKSYEYYGHFLRDRPVTLPWLTYYTMTGVHAAHVLIGVGLFATLAVCAGRGRYLGEDATPVHLSALYWHFVDLVWIFLYPLFYLLEPRG